MLDGAVGRLPSHWRQLGRLCTLWSLPSRALPFDGTKISRINDTPPKLRGVALGVL